MHENRLTMTLWLMAVNLKMPPLQGRWEEWKSIWKVVINKFWWDFSITNLWVCWLNFFKIKFEALGLLEICKKSLSFFYLQLIEIVHHNCHHVGILHTNNFTLFFLNAKASTFIHQPFHHTFIYFLFKHYKLKKQKWIKNVFMRRRRRRKFCK